MSTSGYHASLLAFLLASVARASVGRGLHRYMDDGPLRTNTRACNKGLLDVRFKPYRPLTDRVARINENVYALGDHLLPLKSDNLPDRNREMK